MFWLSETQSVKYDDPQFNTFDLFSHFLSNIVIWAPGNRPGIETEVRKALASIDPDLVVYSVDPYSKILAGDFQQENMIATLTMLFGVLGLVLAAVGLYGVMAYTVEQRTSEIGVRMALGADRPSVVRLVLRGAFFQIGIGLGLGIPLAIVAGRLMTRQLLWRLSVGPAHAHGRYIVTLCSRAPGILDSRYTGRERRAYGRATHRVVITRVTRRAFIRRFVELPGSVLRFDYRAREFGVWRFVLRGVRLLEPERSSSRRIVVAALIHKSRKSMDRTPGE